MDRILVAPSILAADFTRIADEVKKVESSGADFIHIDIMDGHFVPNITWGPKLVRDLRKETSLPLESHLMIEEPYKFLEAFCDEATEWLTLHIETLNASTLTFSIKRIKSLNKKIGLALNPDTPLVKIEPYLGDVDFILVMSVFPGFEGQRFIPDVLGKIRDLREIFPGNIAVDGGIDKDNARMVIRQGANVLCAGSCIFKSSDYKEAISKLRQAGG